MIRQIINLTVVLLIFGCATKQQPKPTFESGTRVGIVNGLEPYFTHQHIAVSPFRSFTKEIEVNWNIPAYLESKLENYLKQDDRFVVVPIESPLIQSQLNQLVDQINTAINRRRVSQNLSDLIEKVADAYDLDVIITVQSFKGESPWKIYDTPIRVQGYGLLTRQTALGVLRIRRHWVHPYAQILVTVFTTRPAAIIGSGRPSLRTRNMRNFDWPADIENIPQAQLDKLRPRIEEYAEQAAINALESANLVAIEAEWR